MRVRFLAEAENELDAAVAYYNGLTAGLGTQFALEVREGLRRVVEFPNAWHRLGPRVRALPAEALPVWHCICAPPIGDRRRRSDEFAPEAWLLGETASAGLRNASVLPSRRTYRILLRWRKT